MMGIGLVSQKGFTFTCSTFLPLIVRTNPGGDEIGLLQTVVAADVCYVPGRDTVATGDAGAGMVAAVFGTL